MARTYKEADIKEAVPLTGKALEARVNALPHLSKREVARACGYFHITKDDKERIDLAAFYEALLATRGIVLDTDKPQDGRGREPSNIVRVHKNGQIIVGAAYTKQLGLEPGTEFRIKLGYKHIHLVRLDEDGQEAADAQDDEVDD